MLHKHRSPAVQLSRLSLVRCSPGIFVLRSGSHFVLRRVALALVAVAYLAAAPATGQEAANERPQHYEIWAGAEAFARVWALYTGGNYAPFGSIASDGVRLRVVAGYGQYMGRRTDDLAQDIRFRVGTSFADLLAGYHKQLGSLTIKILGGVTLTDRATDDESVINVGTELGARALVELWWNFNDRTWTSLDLSWTTLEHVYGARTRVGWRAWPALSVGLEGGVLGNQDYQIGRVGAFVRYEWANGELSLSGGIADNDFEGTSADTRGGYATFNVLTRF